MYSKYCGVPKQEIDVCPSSGWIRDFDNPLTVLYVPFNGAAIVPTNNANWSQLNVPSINSAMNKAELIVDPTAAANAWGEIDKQLVNLAAGLPETFDSQPNIRAANVREHQRPVERRFGGLRVLLARQSLTNNERGDPRL